MPKDKLTVQEVMRYANHDFMNQLQIIKMNLDLGHTEAAKDSIERYAESTRMLSELNRLASPELALWLQTCKWRYPSLQLQLTSIVDEAINIKFDEPLVEYLEKTVLHYYDHLNIAVEAQLTIDIIVTQQQKQLRVCLEGEWHRPPLQLHRYQSIHVDIEEASEECFAYRLTW